MLRRLHEDHANLLRLMAMLERQIDAIERTERPDWDIVQGVVDYLLTYPDLRHHPLEDRILARLEAKHPAEAQPFLELDVEHRELAARLRRIAAATSQLLQDTPMLKSEYLDLLRDFIATQRSHLHREEAGFLPMAKRLLDAADWQALDQAVPHLADPLGDPTDRRFQALRYQLAAWDAADRQARAKDGG
jgi:hemerythrin-like domain-containing protein